MHRTGSRVGRQSGGGQPACPHRPPCPGCPRFGEPDISTAARSTLEALAHRHGLADVPVVSGATSAFRLRARLAIRGRQGAPKIGMFQLGSHRVVPIPNCSVQHPLINRVVAVVRRALVDADVAPYSEAAHAGLARYLQVVVERSSQRAQVVLVANSATVEPLASCLDLVRERLGDELHSLWFNSHCERSNTILGPEFVNWCGPASVIEHFGGAAIHYPPGAFGQNNLDVAERIVEHVRAAGAGGRMRCRVLCGGRCHRPVAAVPRPRNPHERGGPSFAARHGARDRCAGCGRSRQRRSRAGYWPERPSPPRRVRTS